MDLPSASCALTHAGGADMITCIFYQVRGAVPPARIGKRVKFPRGIAAVRTPWRPSQKTCLVSISRGKGGTPFGQRHIGAHGAADSAAHAFSVLRKRLFRLTGLRGRACVW